MWCHAAFKEEKHPAWQIPLPLGLCARQRFFVARVCSGKTARRYRDAFMCSHASARMWRNVLPVIVWCCFLPAVELWLKRCQEERRTDAAQYKLEHSAKNPKSTSPGIWRRCFEKQMCRNVRCEFKKLSKRRNFSIYDSSSLPPCFKVKLMPWTCESVCKINSGVSDMLRIYDAMIEVAHLFPLPSHPSSSLFMEMYSYFPQHILLTHR